MTQEQENYLEDNMAISMFVKKSNKVKIDVFVYEAEDGIEATIERHEVPKDIEPEVVTFIFRRPNYADSNMLLRQMKGFNEDNVDIGPLQNIAMHNMLVDWTLVDDDGKKVSLNRTNIDSLQPSIGRAAALGYLGNIKF